MNADGQAGGSGLISRTVTICNKRGLHARAAAKFVKLAGQFEADVTVVKHDNEVSGRSIMGLMMLAAGPGMSIELRATGSDAQQAMTALADRVTSGFDEE